MKSLIIHMPGTDARQKNVARLLETLPDAWVIDAVNGRDPGQTEGVTLRPGDLHSPAYPFALSPGEVGCFLSHRKCWQMIVDSGEDYALIAEDDLGLDAKVWNDALALITAHAGPDRFIRLPAKRREAPRKIIARQGEAVLFQPPVVGLQTVCQVVGRNAAKRLLAASARIDRPVDTFLQMHWVTGQRVLTIIPNGVRELTAETGGSTIQKKTRTSGKLMREIRRAWYRAQVRMRPQKA
jgi:glycosyl transferase family 25